MGSRASDTLGRMTERPPIALLLGDVLRLRRAHPCGGDEWLVDRLGADIGLRCRALRPPRPGRAPHGRATPRGFVSRGDPAERGRHPIARDARTRRDREPGAAAAGTATAALSRSSRTGSFLLLWLAQAFTQIGGNMVIFGLTIIIAGSTNSTTAVSALILTFLVPAVCSRRWPASSSTASTSAWS